MLVTVAWTKVKLSRGASYVGGLSHPKYAGSKLSTGDYNQTNRAAMYSCTNNSKRRVCARSLWFVGGAREVGGVEGAKLCEKTRSTKSRNTPRSKLGPALHLLCFDRLAIGEGVVRHCDSSRIFPVLPLLSRHLHTYHWHKSSGIHCVSPRSSLAIQ